MALPAGIDDLQKYYDSCLAFLYEYKWLYNYSNTDILVQNALDAFPDDWKSCLETLSYDELCLLPLGYIQEHWPTPLKTFLSKILLLKPKFQQQNILTCDIVEDHVHKDGNLISLKQHTIGMSKKKQHEVANLVNFIGKYCTDTNIIVDIGSGLGYLSQYLHAKYDYLVLGIEVDESKLQSALSRQRKWFPETSSKVRYVQHRVSYSSSLDIYKFLKETEWDLTSGVCIIGLHTCGDLALSAVQIFRHSDFLTKLVIMPCCYHKMEFTCNESGAEKFRNFPLSQLLQSKCDDRHGEHFLRRPFLRLACQQRPGAWRDMINNEVEIRAFRLLSRAVLELYAHRENLLLCKNKRKAVKTQGSGNCFQTYLAEIQTGYTFKSSEQPHVIVEKNDRVLTELWNKYGDHSGLKLSGALVALQACLQPVCENLLLLDKISLLAEADNIASSKFVQIADEALSSRCFCLVSSKT